MLRIAAVLSTVLNFFRARIESMVSPGIKPIVDIHAQGQGPRQAGALPGCLCKAFLISI